MMKPSRIALGWLVTAAITPGALAQVTYTEENGVTYQVTRTPKSIPVTELRTEQHKTYEPRTTTQYQSYQQTYVTPVTQYQWVARQRGQWNPFMRPYWTTELQPVTTWQASQGTIQVPTSQTTIVENNITRQVPVTSYRTVMDEHKVAMGPSSSMSSGTAIASRPAESYGGTQMTSDPPRNVGGNYR